MRAVVGLFNRFDDAQSAAKDFTTRGLPPEQIGVLGQAEAVPTKEMSVFELPGLGRIAANGTMRKMLSAPGGRSNGGMVGALTDLGVSNEDAVRLRDGVKSGAILEAVLVEDDKVADARAIMARHSRSQRQAEAMIPVVREELRIGKREVDTGGVRVSTHVSSVPVEKTVMVREERVTVERRIVDRSIGNDDQAFNERAVELKAESEEPLVSKRAHVVEEIHLHRDRADRIETIEDQLRHTDVRVENLAPQRRGFDPARYRAHFERIYAARKSPYDLKTMLPAYEFGERVREHMPGDDWSDIEADARVWWEGTNPGTWEHYRDAVHEGWLTARK